MTLTEIINQLGHPVKATRGVWSWQTGDRVALVLWSHLISPNGDEYHNPNDGAEGGAGNARDRRRRKHLWYARLHCKGIVSAAIATQDPTTTTERILPGSLVRSRDWIITEFDGRTGEFRLKLHTFGSQR